jgi:hypothetical protein
MIIQYILVLDCSTIIISSHISKSSACINSDEEQRNYYSCLSCFFAAKIHIPFEFYTFRHPMILIIVIVSYVMPFIFHSRRVIESVESSQKERLSPSQIDALFSCQTFVKMYLIQSYTLRNNATLVHSTSLIRYVIWLKTNHCLRCIVVTLIVLWDLKQDGDDDDGVSQLDFISHIIIIWRPLHV